MASQREALKSYLQSDTTLAAILPGSVFDVDDFDFDEGGADDAPRDEHGKIKPFAYIRWRTGVGTEITRSSERRTLEIYLYAPRGKATQEAAIERLKALLHRQQIMADRRGVNMFHWLNDALDIPPAAELGNASAAMTRYYVDFTRR